MILHLLIPLLAFADDKIVVTATRSGTHASELPFSVKTIEGSSWEASGGTAETALARVPGLSVSSNGGPGQTRSLRIRGANAEHTLVLIDGVPASDPLSPSRSFDFGQLPVSEIERVEIIKGPQSVLYGSDAMGGVVQIFTRQHGSRARAEAGSYGTASASLSHLGFRASYLQSNGFSAADAREGNSEPDGLRRWQLGGTKDFAVNDSFLMRLSAQYSDSRVDTDRNGGPGGDSRGTFSRNGILLLRQENLVQLPDEAEWLLAGSLASHDRDDNTNGSDFYRGERWKAESLLSKPFGAHRLTAGLEYGEEAGRSSQITGRRRFRQGALLLQDQAQWERLQATAGLRLDLHSEHEKAHTARLGLAYWLAPELWRVKASLGTGFKAPSLYQTYSAFGSTQLRPERSLGAELGLELTEEDWLSELTLFRNRFRDLIDFDLVANRYFNLKEAEAFGAEWELERRFGFLSLGNSVTWMRSYDPSTGKLLPRRPALSDTLSLRFRKGDFVSAGLLLRYVGERRDTHPVLSTPQTMPAYLTLGLDFSHHLAEGFRFVGRGENLLDRRYQDASGFGTPGLSLYGGIEAEL